MKILIDGQTLSTTDIHRGIGNVFLEIVGNLVKFGRHHEFFVAVYDDYAKDQIEEIRNEIQLVRLGKKIDTGERGGEEYTKRIIHLISENAIDCFLIPNPVMPNVNLIKKPLKCKVLITFYDLIPLIFEEFYLNNWQGNVKQEYLTRLGSLNEIADCILPISTCTKNDLIELLKIHPDKIRTVYPGMKKWNFASGGELSDSTSEKFILYVGGFDPRKNMMNSILAFKRLIDKYCHPDLKYFIVCDYDQTTKDHFFSYIKEQNLLEKVQLKGYVSDYELGVLYHQAELLFFPSLYEGFGLPIVEAMAAGIPVAASSRSSIPELVGEAGLLFDPENIDDMAEKLHRILSDPQLRKTLILHGVKTSTKFSWEKAARNYLDIIESYSTNSVLDRNKISTLASGPKMKIAYFSPIHPQKSGISQYSKELLLELKKYATVDLYLNKNIEPEEPEIRNNFRYFSYTDFENKMKKENYDAILYHIGNNPLHEYIYRTSLRYPGITVLHDYVIHPFIKCVTLDRGKKFQYLIEILHINPHKMIDLAKIILKKGPNFIDVLEFPLNERVIKASKKVIVHSQYVKNLLKKYPNVCVIPHGRYPVDYTKEDILKNKLFLRLDKDELLICIFGFINWNKRVDVVIRVFNKLQIEFANIRLLLVGAINIDIKEMIKEKSEKIDVIGYVTEDIYYKYLGVSDIIVNLRYPTMGETSGTLLDAMRFGKPVIVSNIGSYRETPDNCCWKVDVDEYEEELLFQYLRELIMNPKLREIMGKNAQEFVKKNHDWGIVAPQIIRLVQKGDYP